MKVDPTNVRQGADKVHGAHDTVMQIPMPAYGDVLRGLAGFATAAVFPALYDSLRNSLTVVAGRYEETGQLLRKAADTYEHQDTKNARSLTQLAGDALTSLGDLNSAI